MWLGLCFLGRIIFGRIIFGWCAWGSVFCRMIILCACLAGLCFGWCFADTLIRGYERASASVFIALRRDLMLKMQCFGCGVVGMILPKMILPKMRRFGNSVFLQNHCWVVWLGLCFLGRIILGRIIIGRCGWGSVVSATKRHKKAQKLGWAGSCGGKVFVYFCASLSL